MRKSTAMRRNLNNALYKPGKKFQASYHYVICSILELVNDDLTRIKTNPKQTFCDLKHPLFSKSQQLSSMDKYQKWVSLFLSILSSGSLSPTPFCTTTSMFRPEGS
jgi:hypothetical protein